MTRNSVSPPRILRPQEVCEVQPVFTPRSGLGLRHESSCVAAGEFGGGNRRSADQLLEGIGHAVVAIVAIQLTHSDHVCDQMLRQVSLPELGFPDLGWHVDVLDGAAQNVTELLGVLGHGQ